MAKGGRETMKEAFRVEGGKVGGGLLMSSD